MRGELGECEIADGSANSACNNDASDKEHYISTRGKEKREHAIPVQDVRDGDVQG
jgi:hypothetical protein